VRRGGGSGSEAFRLELLERMEGRLRQSHSGALRRESAQAKAERLAAGELKKLGGAEGGLARRRKSDPAKLAIAARLRRETTLTIKAVAMRLHLGSPESANARLREWRAAQPAAGKAPLPARPRAERAQVGAMLGFDPFSDLFSKMHTLAGSSREQGQLRS